MSVKRLALLAMAAVGALAATASPAFALSATADTSAWEVNGKVRALALSGNTLYVGGKFGLLRAQGGTPKIKLKSVGKVPPEGIDIRSFNYLLGGFTAVRGFPTKLMRPPVIKSGESVTFTNLDALPGETNEQQAWHSITLCRLPCNRDAGIGYPLANGPIKFDSGQLGYGNGFSSEVTTGSNVYTTPPLPYRAGKNKSKKTTTYTYFCRIHPLMRGSIRVRK